MRRYKKVLIAIACMVMAWAAIILIMSIGRAAATDDTMTTIPMLSRQEQIELMKECYEDARMVARRVYSESIMLTFFEYRTR